MVGTTGKEKDRFVVQLTIFKSGRKVNFNLLSFTCMFYSLLRNSFRHLSFQGKVYIILKGTPAPAGKECGGKNTISYEILKNKPDMWGNYYPLSNKAVITVSKSAS